MAETFSYANLPGYSAQTDLQRARHLGYSNIPNRLAELNKLYQNEFTTLQTLKTQDFQQSLLEDQQAAQTGSLTRKGFKQLMGGNKKGSVWNKGINEWWNPGGGTYQHVPKWNEVTGSSDSFLRTSANTKMIDGKQFYKNPDWNAGVGIKNLSAKAADSTLGKVGTAGAGAPMAAIGTIGTGISYLSDDKDPTTYNTGEQVGGAMSWGSTAWQAAAMINPVLAVPAAIAAVLINNRVGKNKAAKALKIQQDHEAKWDAKIKEFRVDQRDISKIGGHKSIHENWWNTTYS